MRGLIIATDGFEDSEFSYPYYRLLEADWEVDVATPTGDPVEGKHGYEFEADFALDEFDAEWYAEEFDLLVLPGGRSPERLRMEAPIAADIVEAFDDQGLPIAAICHGVQLLSSADVIEGREMTGYWTLEADLEHAGATFVDEPVVVDDHFITARYPDDLPMFMGEVFGWIEAEAPITA